MNPNPSHDEANPVLVLSQQDSGLPMMNAVRIVERTMYLTSTPVTRHAM